VARTPRAARAHPSPLTIVRWCGTFPINDHATVTATGKTMSKARRRNEEDTTPYLSAERFSVH